MGSMLTEWVGSAANRRSVPATPTPTPTQAQPWHYCQAMSLDWACELCFPQIAGGSSAHGAHVPPLQAAV